MANASANDVVHITSSEFERGLVLSTIFSRPLSGLFGRLSHVFRPIMHAPPYVCMRNHAISSGMVHGNAFLTPMTLLSETAAISVTVIYKIFISIKYTLRHNGYDHSRRRILLYSNNTKFSQQRVHDICSAHLANISSRSFFFLSNFHYARCYLFTVATCMKPPICGQFRHAHGYCSGTLYAFLVTITDSSTSASI